MIINGRSCGIFSLARKSTVDDFIQFFSRFVFRNIQETRYWISTKITTRFWWKITEIFECDDVSNLGLRLNVPFCPQPDQNIFFVVYSLRVNIECSPWNGKCFMYISLHFSPIYCRFRSIAISESTADTFRFVR